MPHGHVDAEGSGPGFALHLDVDFTVCAVHGFGRALRKPVKGQQGLRKDGRGKRALPNTRAFEYDRKVFPCSMLFGHAIASKRAAGLIWV